MDRFAVRTSECRRKQHISTHEMEEKLANSSASSPFGPVIRAATFSRRKNVRGQKLVRIWLEPRGSSNARKVSLLAPRWLWPLSTQPLDHFSYISAILWVRANPRPLRPTNMGVPRKQSGLGFALTQSIKKIQCVVVVGGARQQSDGKSRKRAILYILNNPWS